MFCLDVAFNVLKPNSCNFASSYKLVPKITRNYLKEGYMEKTGPLVRYHFRCICTFIYNHFSQHSAATFTNMRLDTVVYDNIMSE